jgi:hypothetical protein
MARTDESDILLDRLDSRFRQLLNEQFEYANDTERNRHLKAQVGADVWCLFKVLLESESLKDIHKKHITYKLLAEIRRRRSMA